MATITPASTNPASPEYTFSSAAFRKKRGKKKLRNKKIITEEQAVSRRKLPERSTSTSALLSASTRSTSTPALLSASTRTQSSRGLLETPKANCQWDLPASTKSNVAVSLHTASFPATNASASPANVVSTRKDQNDPRVSSQYQQEHQLDLSSARLKSTQKPWETDIRKKDKTEDGDRLLREAPSSEERMTTIRSATRRSRSLSTTRHRSLSTSFRRRRSTSRRGRILTAQQSFSDKQDSAVMGATTTTTDSDNDDDSVGLQDFSDDDETYEKYRQFLASTKSDDNDEHLSRQSVLTLKQKVGAAPSLNFSYRYSAAADELLGLGNADDYERGEKASGEEEAKNTVPSESENLRVENEDKEIDLAVADEISTKGSDACSDCDIETRREDLNTDASASELGNSTNGNEDIEQFLAGADELLGLGDGVIDGNNSATESENIDRFLAGADELLGLEGVVHEDGSDMSSQEDMNAITEAAKLEHSKGGDVKDEETSDPLPICDDYDNVEIEGSLNESKNSPLISESNAKNSPASISPSRITGTSITEGLTPPTMQEPQQEIYRAKILNSSHESSIDKEYSQSSENELDKLDNNDGSPDNDTFKAPSLTTLDEKEDPRVSIEDTVDKSNGNDDAQDYSISKTVSLTTSDEKDDSHQFLAEGTASINALSCSYDESKLDSIRQHGDNMRSPENNESPPQEKTGVHSQENDRPYDESLYRQSDGGKDRLEEDRGQGQSFNSEEPQSTQHSGKKDDVDCFDIDESTKISNQYIVEDGNGSENSSFQNVEEDPEYPEDDRKILSLLYHIHTS